MIVAYRYSFVGGDRLDNSTGDERRRAVARRRAARLVQPDAARTRSRRAFQIVEPYCNGLPVITEG